MVDDAHPEPGTNASSGRSAVELLTEIDNLNDVDRLVTVGQELAAENRKALESFVRHSLFAQAKHTSPQQGQYGNIQQS